MYTAAGQPTREQLVQRFVPLVKRIAYHLMARLPASVQFEDLVQNGMMGLLDAISRFEAGMGAQFETYAAQPFGYAEAVRYIADSAAACSSLRSAAQTMKRCRSRPRRLRSRRYLSMSRRNSPLLHSMQMGD